jgi:nucleotide-binding universal stress UspA family protein
MVTKILVPTDFSEPSMKGLDYAIDLARRLHAGVVIVHVVEPFQYMGPLDIYGTLPNTAMWLSEQRKAAKTQLAGLEKSLKKRRIKFQTVLSTGAPHQQIVDAAKKLEADLIVMATHGRSGLSHLLLGSVAEKVVRTALCPVLTVRDFKSSRRRRTGVGAQAKRKKNDRTRPGSSR